LVDQTSTCNPGAPGSSNIKGKKRERQQENRTTREERREGRNRTACKENRQTTKQAKVVGHLVEGLAKGRKFWTKLARFNSKRSEEAEGGGRRRGVSCADVSKGFKN
jgi:hypothetical protein